MPGDAAITVRNILAHEAQFRVGIGGELLMLNSDILLSVALYALLKPVDPNLALLGAFWRLADAVFCLAASCRAVSPSISSVTFNTRAKSAPESVCRWRPNYSTYTER